MKITGLCVQDGSLPWLVFDAAGAGSSARDVHWGTHTPGAWASYSMAAGFPTANVPKMQAEVARLL